MGVRIITGGPQMRYQGTKGGVARRPPNWRGIRKLVASMLAPNWWSLLPDRPRRLAAGIFASLAPAEQPIAAMARAEGRQRSRDLRRVPLRPQVEPDP